MFKIYLYINVIRFNSLPSILLEADGEYGGDEAWPLVPELEITSPDPPLPWSWMILELSVGSCWACCWYNLCCWSCSSQYAKSCMLFDYKRNFVNELDKLIIFRSFLNDFFLRVVHEISNTFKWWIHSSSSISMRNISVFAEIIAVPTLIRPWVRPRLMSASFLA